MRAFKWGMRRASAPPSLSLFLCLCLPVSLSLSLSVSFCLSEIVFLRTSLCKPSWPQFQRFTCLCLPNAGMKGLCHHIGPVHLHFNNLLLFICVGVLPALHMCVWGCQILKLQTVVSCCNMCCNVSCNVGAGNWIQVLWKSSQYSFFGVGVEVFLF